MKALVADLPSESAPFTDDVSLRNTAGQLNEAEGQALRALRLIVFEHDRQRAFGGMRRVQAPSGDFLWVCPDHYREYDPGLPTVP
jgi:internalin A